MEEISDGSARNVILRPASKVVNAGPAILLDDICVSGHPSRGETANLPTALHKHVWICLILESIA